MKIIAYCTFFLLIILDSYISSQTSLILDSISMCVKKDSSYIKEQGEGYLIYCHYRICNNSDSTLKNVGIAWYNGTGSSVVTDSTFLIKNGKKIKSTVHDSAFLLIKDDKNVLLRGIGNTKIFLFYNCKNSDSCDTLLGYFNSTSYLSIHPEWERHKLKRRKCLYGSIGGNFPPFESDSFYVQLVYDSRFEFLFRQPIFPLKMISNKLLIVNDKRKTINCSNIFKYMKREY